MPAGTFRALVRWVPAQCSIASTTSRNRYGPHDILKGVTWQHNPGEHVGLVGRNGAGQDHAFPAAAEAGGAGSRRDLPRVRADHRPCRPASRRRAGDVALRFRRDRVRRTCWRSSGRCGPSSTTWPTPSRAAPSTSGCSRSTPSCSTTTSTPTATRSTPRSSASSAGVGFSDKAEWERPIAEFSGGQQNRAMLARVLLTEGRPAAPRRADQPSRPQRHRVPRGVPAVVQGQLPAHLARPDVSQPHGRRRSSSSRTESWSSTTATTSGSSSSAPSGWRRWPKDYERQQEYIAEDAGLHPPQPRRPEDEAGQVAPQDARQDRRAGAAGDRRDAREVQARRAGRAPAPIALTADRLTAGYRRRSAWSRTSR